MSSDLAPRVPAPATLLGRTAEIAWLREGIRTWTTVEVTGPPGIGVSSLLRHVATADLDLDDPARRVYVDVGAASLEELLRRLVDELVPVEVLRTAAAPASGPLSAAEAARMLTPMRVVLLLDDVRCSPETVAGLRRAMPRSCLVVGGRVPLLGEPGRCLTLGGVPDDAALYLLYTGMGRPLTPHDHLGALRLVEAVGAHPARLRRAAALVRSGRHTFGSLAQLAVTDPRALDQLSRSDLPRPERAVLDAVTAAKGLRLPAEQLEQLVHEDDVPTPAAPPRGAREGGTPVTGTPLSALVDQGLLVQHEDGFTLVGDLLVDEPSQFPPSQPVPAQSPPSQPVPAQAPPAHVVPSQAVPAQAPPSLPVPAQPAPPPGAGTGTLPTLVPMDPQTPAARRGTGLRVSVRAGATAVLTAAVLATGVGYYVVGAQGAGTPSASRVSPPSTTATSLPTQSAPTSPPGSTGVAGSSTTVPATTTRATRTGPAVAPTDKASPSDAPSPAVTDTAPGSATGTRSLPGGVRPARAPELAPMRSDLGEAEAVPGADPATTTVTVANSNSSPVTLRTLSVSGPGFTLSGRSCGAALPAGGRCTLTVAFQPRELGRAEGTLVVGTAEGGSSRVSLTGVGYVDLQVAVSTAGGAQGPGGSVTGAGGQVDCSERCSVRLRSADRSTVTLRAVPAAGFRFEGWSGDCGSADASCTLQMTSSRSVTATFAPEPGSPAP